MKKAVVVFEDDEDDAAFVRWMSMHKMMGKFMPDIDPMHLVSAAVALSVEKDDEIHIKKGACRQ
jgi:hypothetical protein